MVGVCGESENRNVWLRMWSQCGQKRGVLWSMSAVAELASGPRSGRVKYWNLKQEGLGADEESGWVINDPTAAIRPAL